MLASFMSSSDSPSSFCHALPTRMGEYQTEPIANAARVETTTESQLIWEKELKISMFFIYQTSLYMLWFNYLSQT